MSVTKGLKGHELFQSLSFEEIDRISSFARARQYRAGEEIFGALEHLQAELHVALLLETGRRRRRHATRLGAAEVAVQRRCPLDQVAR